MRLRALMLFIVPVLAAGPAAAAGPSALAIDYSGRVTVAGQPFSGEREFKFALVDAAGRRVWTSGDGEAPIEAGVPSGSVPLTVTGGAYRVRLGDPAAGMAALGPEVTANHLAALQVQTWINDGTRGWADAGVTALSAQAAKAAPATAGTPEGDMQQTILTEVRRLRVEVMALRKELRTLRPATAAQAANAAPATVSPTSKPQPKPKPAAAPVRVALDEVARHSLGSADAPVVLVEFTDFECGYCKRFFDETLPLLKERYIDTGKLRFVSRNLPIRSHPQAGPAAHALLSAAAQDPDQYWAMRAWLFEHNRELNEVAYGTYVKDAGLDVPRFLTDFTARRNGPELDADVAAAHAVGITGTPSFVIGTSDGKTIDGERVVGAKSFAIFSSKIEALLAARENTDNAEKSQ